MSPNKKNFIIAALLATAIPGSLLAQVPSTRPGLVIGQPGYVPPPAQTTLVQRQYDPSQAQPGQAGQVPPGYVPQAAPPQEDFFFVDQGSQGPQNLTDGLSDYNTQRMNQAGEQLRGNYSSIAQTGMPAGMTQEAWNRPFEHMSAGQVAPGTIRYQWSSDLVMPIRLRAGMVTSIVLPDWEAAQDVVIGDGSAIEASILRPNQVAVKSVQTGMDTSLSITGGSGNVYTFYLRTEGRNTTLVTDLQVFVQASPSNGSGEWFNGEVRNAYTPAPKSSAGASGSSHPSMPSSQSISLPSSASQGDEPVPVDRRVFNLKMFEVNEGDRIIAPEFIYTDGRFTYLHFPAAMADRPAVFRIADGAEGRVNTRISGRHGEVVVVESLGDFILRSGTRAVCIKVVDGEDQVVYR